MKKLQLLAALSFICTGAYCQLTGLNTYQHPSIGPNLRLSDGTTTSYYSKGFLFAGYVPSPSGSAVLYIDKTDKDGMFNGVGGEFAREYKFSADPVNPCGAGLVPAANCYGISIAEIKFLTPLETYVIAAAFERGCFFSSLNKIGNIVGPGYYTFPANAVNPSKPLICPSVLNPGNFYISGSYELSGLSHMYIMQVTFGGGFGWSVEYTSNSGANEFIPSAIMESPYTSASSPELVIVGTCFNTAAQFREGFFSRFKGNNGGFLQCDLYGTGVSTNERFLSIAQAVGSAPGAPGYIIGGYTDVNPAAGTSWMVRTDQLGAIQWTKIIKPSIGTNGEVTGVRERKSAFYGQFEYYGTSNDNNGMTVFKLDDLGNMFSQPGNTTNEFVYNDNSGNPAQPVAITDFDNGSLNDGIHVYGTNNTNTPGDYFLTRACFNGAAGNGGCNFSNILLNSIGGASNGPNNVTPLAISMANGLPNCPKFSVGDAVTPLNIVAPCNLLGNPTAPYIGNQNRTMAPTGINALSSDTKFSVSPNPVTDKLVINYSANAGSEVSIAVFNNLGQLVSPAVTPKTQAGDNVQELDLTSMNINSGVYFVKVNVDGMTTTKKIIYTK